VQLWESALAIAFVGTFCFHTWTARRHPEEQEGLANFTEAQALVASPQFPHSPVVASLVPKLHLGSAPAAHYFELQDEESEGETRLAGIAGETPTLHSEVTLDPVHRLVMVYQGMRADDVDTSSLSFLQADARRDVELELEQTAKDSGTHHGQANPPAVPSSLPVPERLRAQTTPPMRSRLPPTGARRESEQLCDTALNRSSPTFSRSAQSDATATRGQKEAQRRLAHAQARAHCGSPPTTPGRALFVRHPATANSGGTALYAMLQTLHQQPRVSSGVQTEATHPEICVAPRAQAAARSATRRETPASQQIDPDRRRQKVTD